MNMEIQEFTPEGGWMKFYKDKAFKSALKDAFIGATLVAIVFLAAAMENF